MNTKDFEGISNQIFRAIFGQDCPYDLQELKLKFAFDIKLPELVKDSFTGEDTYSAVANGKAFIKDTNNQKRSNQEGWMLPKRDIHSLKELIEIWQSVNYITTERVYDSENVLASDPIYNSINVYNSTNCGECKNILYCDGTYESNFSIACQRSTGLNYCIRTDDSNTCTNSYNVICSGNVSNSFFIQDAGHLHECMFCSHISHQEYCIANMQFDKAEYELYKAKIIEWILSEKSSAII